jgi:hypothetical protein
LSIGRAARKRHDSPDGCRQSEGRATRDECSTSLECRDRLRDALGGQPNFAPDVLQLRKRQTIARRVRRCRAAFLTDGQLENLPDFVLLVPALVAHVDDRSAMSGNRAPWRLLPAGGGSHYMVMNWRSVGFVLAAACFAACGGDAGDDTNANSQGAGNSDADENNAGDISPSESAADSSEPSGDDSLAQELPTFCPDVGPPCGLTVTFEPTGLALGRYSIEVTTSAGVTSCNYAVEPERIQTQAEAEAQDAMLAECSARGDCPRRPCTGPNTVYVRADGLTIVEESTEVSVVIQALATGQSSAETFAPAYSDHPARTAECSLCRVADDSMPPPR